MAGMFQGGLIGRIGRKVANTGIGAQVTKKLTGNKERGADVLGIFTEDAKGPTQTFTAVPGTANKKGVRKRRSPRVNSALTPQDTQLPYDVLGGK